MERSTVVRMVIFKAALIAVAIALVFILYAPSFQNEWLMDDFPVIVENSDIRAVSNFIEDRYPGRPLREVSYLLDYALFELNPSGYHIQQNLMHALNAYLFFVLVLNLGSSRLVAWFASLLFLSHPINVEVVANISHRKDCLPFRISSYLYTYTIGPNP